MINIYCDESCHLEHDKQKVMAIGGIACPNYAKFNVYKDIKKIKEKHSIMSYQEIKHIPSCSAYKTFVYLTGWSNAHGRMTIVMKRTYSDIPWSFFLQSDK